MSLSSSARGARREATSGSAPTRVEHEHEHGRRIPDGTLRLRGASRADQQRGIRWAEDVVDNEGMGKKKSKACCIYHRPRDVNESSSGSSSSSSDSDSDSDSEPDNSTARPVGGARRRGTNRGQHGVPRPDSDPQQDGDHDGPDDHAHGDDGGGVGGGGGGRRCKPEKKRKGARHRAPSPNAYEKMPKSAGNRISKP
ncbi:MAG: hypothetical protein M1837_004806 [Sclerophora amabilis]|nr:MAG: hypothetical protein M1837_004806 [Sclerophora amabilis]